MTTSSSHSGASLIAESITVKIAKPISLAAIAVPQILRSLCCRLGEGIPGLWEALFIQGNHNFLPAMLATSTKLLAGLTGKEDLAGKQEIAIVSNLPENSALKLRTSSTPYSHCWTVWQSKI